MNFLPVAKAIKKYRRFLISTHIGPDPDAICSELVLADCLRALGKSVVIVNEEPLPERFLFFKGSRQVRSIRKVKRVDYDVAVVVDCGELKRIGKVQQLLQPGKPILNIDHHVTNDRFGDISLIVPGASSTVEVLYGLLKHLRCKFTSAIAENIYIGMMTDTGSFRYENTTAKTHAIASELMRFNICPNKIYQRIYETIPLQDLKGFGEVLSSFSLYFNGRIICVELTKKTLKKFSEAFDLRDAVFKYLRSIKGIDVVAIFTEAPDGTTRVNLRSTGRVDVAAIAHHFQGGGHKRASGGVIAKGLQAAKKEFLQYIKGIV